MANRFTLDQKIVIHGNLYIIYSKYYDVIQQIITLHFTCEHCAGHKSTHAIIRYIKYFVIHISIKSGYKKVTRYLE